MSEPIQIIPTLTLLEDDGEFTVRVGAQANAAKLAASIIPIIAGVGARKLLIITPTDTKVYKFTPTEPALAEKVISSASPISRRIIQDFGAPPAPETVSDEYSALLLQQEKEAKEIREMSAVAGADPHLPTEEEPIAPRKRGRPALIKPATNPCGRCSGAGTLPEGGGCPVCRGEGTVSQWGRKRG